MSRRLTPAERTNWKGRNALTGDSIGWLHNFDQIIISKKRTILFLASAKDKHQVENEIMNNSGLHAPGEATGESNPQTELRVLNDSIAALQVLPNNDVRERVLQAAAAFFRISLGTVQQSSSRSSNATHSLVGSSSFSEDRTPSPKDFLIQKQPRTEVERVACLAYYLTHYRDIKHFKTIDISTLNTEAAQPKFTNAAQAVENALKTHYLAPAAKGLKQLSAPGEIFVQNLPDREAARAAMASIKPRRRKKFGLQTTELEEISASQ